MTVTCSATLALLLIGCAASSDIVSLDPSPRPQRAPADVQVLASDPRRPYREIALIEVSGGYRPTLNKWVRVMKERAARMGGDAVVIMGRSESPGLLARVIVFESSPDPR